MANTTKTKDSYAVLENEKEISQNTTPASPENPSTPPVVEKHEENIPVQNTSASVHDDVNWIDITIKVIIDILARLTGQKSPTGGKLPTAGVPQAKAQQVSTSFLGSVTGGLQKIGNSMEKIADSAVSSAGSVAQKAKESAQSTVNQAVNIAKDQAQSTVGQVVQKAKDSAQSTVNQAVNVAKEQAQGVVDAAKVAGQSTLNVAKDSVGGAVDTAKNTVSNTVTPGEETSKESTP